MSTTDFLIQLFAEVDTPDLRDIVGEDAFITSMRNVYHRVRRRLDCDISLGHLIEQALEDECSRIRQRSEAK